MKIEAEVIPRRGSKTREDGRARDDALRVLRNAVESLFCGFQGHVLGACDE